MSQNAVQVPESAPQEESYDAEAPKPNHANDDSDSESKSDNANFIITLHKTNDINNNNNNNNNNEAKPTTATTMNQTKQNMPKSSLKSPTRNMTNTDTDTDTNTNTTNTKGSRRTTTAVSESQHSSQNNWSSPFRQLSKSLIGFFLTVLVIARIKKQKDNKNSNQNDEEAGGGPMPNVVKPKKSVRILDMSGNLTTPNTPSTTITNDDYNNSYKRRNFKDSRQLDANSECDMVYKPILVKVAVFLCLGILALVLYVVLK
ncbi:unnamed protein product [Cylindrotheca closterium]|uniref:Uncharacterized protein n=1 Tax=Cylindrotheca closterium TaxID=2856 RepID=A0AAD2PXU0_9STRA|nr:unnamed protein product [Cylindrotheca closterium]